MIDLHCHVLPGIDDGPGTLADSLVLARAAVAAGTRVLVATPHINSSYHNDADTIARLADELNARLAVEGIDLEIRTGAEIAVTRLIDIPAAELPRLCLGAGAWLLVEPPFAPTVMGLDSILLDLQRQGHRILLAHPERCQAFHRDPEMLSSLVRAGVLTSITAGSLVGRFGGTVRRFALALAREGLIHNVASDAHDVAQRPPGVTAELAQAGMGALAGWLTEQVPAAILDGQEIPPRPAPGRPSGAPRGRAWWRRLTTRDV